MELNGLIGLDITVYISDPWKFGTQCGCGPFQASLVDAKIAEGGVETIMLHLARAFHYEGKNITHLEGTPRHIGDTFLSVQEPGKKVPVAFLSFESLQSGKENLQALPYEYGVIGSIELST